MQLLLLLVAAVRAASKCACESSCSGWCWVDHAQCPDAQLGWVAYWQSCDVGSSTPAVKASFASTASAMRSDSGGARGGVLQRWWTEDWLVVEDHLPSQVVAKPALFAVVAFKFALSPSLDAQDAYWEDATSKTHSPWQASGSDKTQHMLVLSLAGLFLAKRVVYFISDFFFYVAVLTVLHVSTHYIMFELWRDLLTVVAGLSVLIGLKASEMYCPEQRFVNGFWRICEGREGLNLLALIMFCFVAPPVCALMFHWWLTNTTGRESDGWVLLFGVCLLVAEYDQHLPTLAHYSAKCQPACDSAGEAVRGAGASLHAACDSAGEAVRGAGASLDAAVGSLYRGDRGERQPLNA